MDSEIRVRHTGAGGETDGGARLERDGGPFAGLPNERRAYDDVLEVTTRIVSSTEKLDIEANSRARREMADIKEEEMETEQALLTTARDRSELFRAAVDDAWQRGQRGAIVYASADPTEDAYADVLIQSLVRAEYAEVHAQESPGQQYRYHFTIAWDRLRNLAARAEAVERAA